MNNIKTKQAFPFLNSSDFYVKEGSICTVIALLLDSLNAKSLKGNQ